MMNEMLISPASLPGTACPRCRGTTFRHEWQTFCNGTKHVRRTCLGCGAFMGYAPQEPASPPANGLTASPQQEAIRQAVVDGSQHVLIEARAGVGKTTTLVECLQ